MLNGGLHKLVKISRRAGYKDSLIEIRLNTTVGILDKMLNRVIDAEKASSRRAYQAHKACKTSKDCPGAFATQTAGLQTSDCVLVNAELSWPSCWIFYTGAFATQTAEAALQGVPANRVLVNVEPSEHYTNTSTREYSPHKLQSKDAPLDFCMTPTLTASPQEPSLHKLQTLQREWPWASRRRLSAQHV
ncbi:uncharacterized protein LOC142592765 [Dermacentor variabilis]|uniref:uncharacterized protein LOC142592765 n=1 Tax=Dermacentor variabilis TaxID=34621 RepID=UPI003F5B04B8